jgi:uncharacterized protein (DUF433 family)
MSGGTRTRGATTYVQQRDGGYWIAGTRISLDSVVHAFKRGAAPESIQRAFPLLTLEEVYGAIAFYLARSQEIDAYLDREEAAFGSLSRDLNAVAQARNPELLDRLRHVRRGRKTSPQ